MIRLQLVISFLCLAFISFSQNYTSRLFSTDQGLPDTYIYSVVQDDKGFLWIATGKGLVRFDGQIFKRYDLRAEDGDDIIYSSAIDKNKELWFGTFSGKIYKLDERTGRLKLYPKQLGGSVNKIITSQKGSRLFLFSKGNGIYTLENSRLTQIEGTQNYEINCLEPGADDEMIMGTAEGLFTIGKAGEISKIKNFEPAVKQLQRLDAKKGTYVVATAKGMFEIALSNNTAVITGSLNTIKDFPLSEVTAFCLNEKNNTLYIGTSDEKFVVLDLQNKKVKQINENDFLATANAIFIDRESNAWVSTTGKGLYRLLKTDFDFIDTNDESIFAITQDNLGNTYYGTKNGVLVINAAGVSKTIEKTGNKTLGKVNALFFDGTAIWIGTDNNGLTLLSAANMQPLNIEFSTIGNIAVNTINGSADEIYVNTNLDGVYIYNTDRNLKFHFSVQNSLLHNNVYAAIKSKSGKTYYATHNTAFNFSVNDQVYEIDTKQGGLISDYNAFAEDKNGSVMVGTNGDGIYILNDTVIHRFALNDRLESKFCSGLLYDNNNDLWIEQRYGLYKYYTKEKILKKVHFNLNSNVFFNFNSVYKNKNGDLFFGTGKNAVTYKNDAAKKNANLLPQSYIVSVRLFDSVINPANSLKLKSGKYNFTFGYSALSLKNSEDVTFRYILAGRDNNWSEPTKSRRIEFSNLSEGDYTFKVMAFNSEGFPELQPVAFTFSISKPFWKNAWFWTLLVVIIATLVFFVIRIRVANLLKAKARLETIVEEKTKQLREEKEVVEASNRVIAEQNEDITASITYAKRIQDALLPGKQVLQDKSKDLFIFYQPRDIVSGDFYWLGEMNGLKFIVAADCTGHGVPGGFMTMIGNTLLNKIILERKITEPKDILKELDKEVRHSLKQYTEDATRDGMDLAMCCMDGNKKITYAGALRPLFQVSQGQMTEYEPTKYAIGGYNYGQDRAYKQTEIIPAGNDMLYIFSDGFADQFGGEKGKKFMLKNFKQLLIEIAELPLDRQEEALRTAYNNWKGDTEQIDDVLVIGIRL